MMQKALVVFLFAEAFATAVWWLLLFAVPTTRHYFLPHTWPDSVLLSFAAGDLLLIVAGGLVAAVGLRRRAAWAMFALALHTGAVVYATLYTVAAWIATVQGGIGALLMVADALGLGILTADRLRREGWR